MKQYKNNVFTQSKFLLLICIVLAALLQGCKSDPEHADLSRIMARGHLTVGTLYGSTSYYLGAEGPTGFEYELAQKYAEYLGVELKVIPSYNLDELFSSLIRARLT